MREMGNLGKFWGNFGEILGKFWGNFWKPIQAIKTDSSFIVQWVLVTFGGFVVSLLFIEIGEKPDIGALEGVTGGAAIGLAQFLILRQRISPAWGWILASILTWGFMGGSGLGAVGWVAPRTGNIALRAVYGTIHGAQLGMWMGASQWWILRNKIPKASRWIWISSFGWAIAMSLGWIVGGIFRLAFRLFMGEIVGLGVAWLVVSITTGVALVVCQDSFE